MSTVPITTDMETMAIVAAAIAKTMTGSGSMPLPRLAVSPEEAASALGVSRDFFDEHIAPELRIVRRGRRRLVGVGELERWLSESASLVFGNGHARG
jgi:hypothetical protein